MFSQYSFFLYSVGVDWKNWTLHSSLYHPNKLSKSHALFLSLYIWWCIDIYNLFTLFTLLSFLYPTTTSNIFLCIFFRTNLTMTNVNSDLSVCGLSPSSQQHFSFFWHFVLFFHLQNHHSQGTCSKCHNNSVFC